MAITIRLTEKQRKLAESNLHIVRFVIYESIVLNEAVVGLGYEDIFQEGCYYLCKAAATYNQEKSQFDTYAKKVIRNGLISHCRKMQSENSHYAGVSLDEQDNLIHHDILLSVDASATRIAALEVQDVLQSYAKGYDGITRIGAEALGKKVMGPPLSQIAKEYEVPVNHVGAWISRAVAKLRQDPLFLQDLQ